MSEGTLRNLWKAHRARIQIAVFVGSIALAIAIPFIQEPLCSISEPSSDAAAYKVSIDRESHKQNGSASELPAISQFTLGPTVDSGIQTIERTDATYYAPQKKEDWGRRYWCDVNVSDYFLVLFTLALAVSTFFLWRQTERLAEGADGHAEKMDASILAANEANKISASGQRAWMAIENVKLIYPTSIPNLDRGPDPKSEGARWTKLVVRATFRNIGHSPAGQFKVSCKLLEPVSVELEPHMPGYQYSSRPVRSDGASVILPGDQEHRTFEFTGSPPPDRFEDRPTPHLSIALEVSATYRISTDDDTHTTHFAYRDAVPVRAFGEGFEIPLTRDGERDRDPT